MTAPTRWRRAWPQVLVAAVGLGISLLLSGGVASYNRQQTQERFERHAERIEKEVQQRFRLPLYGLQGAVGLHAGSGELTLPEFRTFMAALNLRDAYPGIRGMGLIERVPVADTARYEAAVQLADDPSFRVREMAPSPHTDRYVIRYIEPQQDNLVARGLDVGSEALRREAIERAIDSGDPTLTPPVTLVQDGPQRPGFLMYDPAYRRLQGREPNTPAERRQALAGVFYTPIVADELLGTVAALADGLVDFELFAGNNSNNLSQLVFDSDGHLSAQPPVPDGGRAFRLTRPLDLLGQPYLLQVSSTPAFDATSGGAVAPLTLLAGLLITALLTYLLRVVALGRERAELLASRMTQDLDRLAKVAQRTSNAVVITDVHRRITWVNEAFERITGFTSQEAMGESPGELLQCDNTDPLVVQRMRETLDRAQPFQGEVLNRHKDGREYWLQLEIQPLRDRTGALTGFMAIESDITAQKQAELALRDFGERMTLAADSAGLGVWEIDMVNGLRHWDPQMYRMFGVDPASAQAEPLSVWQRTLHPDDRARTNEALATALAGGRPFQAEFRLIGDDGVLRHLRGAAHVVRDPQGRALRMIGLNHDVTEQRLLEQELREQNDRMRSILEALPCGMSVFDKHLNLVASNSEYRRLLDFPEHLFEQQPPRFEDFIRYNAQRGEYGAGDVEAIVADIVTRARGKARAHRFERVRPDGIPLEVQGAPLPGGGFVTTYVDISERKQAEEAIAQKEALLRGAIDTVNEAFVLYDPNDRLVFCNEKYRDMYASSADVIVPGARFEDIIRTGAERGQYAAAVGRVDAWVAERMARHREANTSLVQHLDDGRVVRVVERRMTDGHTVGFRIDITDLVRATEAAEAASRSKTQFLANMSHEIRTPMNAVLGMLALLRRSALSPRQADHAAKAEGAARSLLNLLNDILDFSKVEAGKMTLENQPFDIDSLLRDLGLILTMNAASKPLRVLYDIDPALPPVLVGDALRLQQVLVNLGGNAVKFTAQGEVVVSLSQVAQTDTDITLEVAVTDTGIGIAPENRQKIFSGFTQAEADTTRRFGGTGLGLAISQRLVALLGGELQLDSTLGQGSRFHFRLTLARPEPAASAASEATGTHTTTRCVLVVEPHPLAARLLQRMLDAMGMQVQTQATADAALAHLAQDGGCDVVLVSTALPGQGALALCREVMRRAVAPRCVLLTSRADDVLPDDAPAGLVWLSQPVTPGDLRAALEAAVAPAPALPHAHTASARRLAGLRLLLAEDNPLNQQVARELLESEGAHVTLVDNGEQAVLALTATPAAWDVVLMDLQMPVMDGLTATRQLRQNPDPVLSALPVVAMTANASAADRQTCLDAGMNDHVGKPFVLDQLVTVLRTNARLPEWPPVASHAAAATTGATEQADATPATPPLPSANPLPSPVLGAAAAAGVALDAALDRLGGRSDVYHRLLQGFVQDSPPGLDRLAQALDAGDTASLRVQLHTLKGLAATLGLSDLARAAAAAEPPPAAQSGHAAPADARPVWQAWQAALAPAQALAEALANELADTRTDVQAPATGHRVAGHPPPTGEGGNTAPAAPPAAEIKALRSLMLMLDAADMAATDAVDRLLQAPDRRSDPRWQALHEAVMALDFPRAHGLCQALLD